MKVPWLYDIPRLTKYELNLNWITFIALIITSALAIGKLLTNINYGWAYVVSGFCLSTIPAFLKATIAEHKLVATTKRDGERSMYNTELKKEKIISFLQSVPAPTLIRIVSVLGEEPINLAKEIIEVCKLTGWTVDFGKFQYFPGAPILKGVKIHPYNFGFQAEVLLNLFAACNIKASIQQESEDNRDELYLLIAYHP